MAESVKTIGTTKDKTMAIETRAGVRAGVLKNETPELKAHIYLQYMGKEFSTADVMKQIRQIWTKELRRSPEELRSVNVYLKPEEFAAYYVINDEVNGKIDVYLKPEEFAAYYVINDEVNGKIDL